MYSLFRKEQYLPKRSLFCFVSCFFRDITYEISVEAVSTMVVFLSCQLFHKEVLRQSISHKYLMRGRCLPYTSKLVKTLLYNVIRQEKPPPPGTHVLPQQSDGGGLLYGLASGVASKSYQNLSVLWCM